MVINTIEGANIPGVYVANDAIMNKRQQMLLLRIYEKHKCYLKSCCRKCGVLRLQRHHYIDVMSIVISVTRTTGSIGITMYVCIIQGMAEFRQNGV